MIINLLGRQPIQSQQMIPKTEEITIVSLDNNHLSQANIIEINRRGWKIAIQQYLATSIRWLVDNRPNVAEQITYTWHITQQHTLYKNCILIFLQPQTIHKRTIGDRQILIKTDFDQDLRSLEQLMPQKLKFKQKLEKFVKHYSELFSSLQRCLIQIAQRHLDLSYKIGRLLYGGYFEQYKTFLKDLRQFLILNPHNLFQYILTKQMRIYLLENKAKLFAIIISDNSQQIRMQKDYIEKQMSTYNILNNLNTEKVIKTNLSSLFQQCAGRLQMLLSQVKNFERYLQNTNSKTTEFLRQFIRFQKIYYQNSEESRETESWFTSADNKMNDQRILFWNVNIKNAFLFILRVFTYYFSENHQFKDIVPSLPSILKFYNYLLSDTLIGKLLLRFKFYEDQQALIMSSYEFVQKFTSYLVTKLPLILNTQRSERGYKYVKEQRANLKEISDKVQELSDSVFKKMQRNGTQLSQILNSLTLSDSILTKIVQQLYNVSNILQIELTASSGLQKQF